MMMHLSGKNILLALLTLNFLLTLNACTNPVIREQASQDEPIVVTLPRRQPASQYRDVINCKATKITNENLNNELYRDSFSVEGYPVVTVSALSDSLNPDYAMLVGANPSYEKGVDGVTKIADFSERTVTDYRVSFKDNQMLRLYFDGRRGQLRFGAPKDVLAKEVNSTVFAELSCKLRPVRAGY